jgi:hypothetical protein
MANGNGKGPGSKKKKVKSNVYRGTKKDAQHQSFDHDRDTKEYKRKKKKRDQLTNLNKKKDSRVLEGKGTKTIDRRIKRR